jgi:putative Mg2+ transporter-C (MgtC) family protein
VSLDTWEVAARLVLAAAAGAVVGFEREHRARVAGLRTHAIVSVGAALFTMAGAYGFTDAAQGADIDPTRIAAQIAVGVGFIGAGAIMRNGASVSGVTTAASIWLSAAIGVAVGAGAYVAVLIATVLSLVLLVMLRAVKSVSRRISGGVTVIDVEYERGHGTLGPVLRSIETLNGHVEHISIDDDEPADGDGRRHVEIRVVGPPPEEVKEALDRLAERDEIRVMSVS